MSGDATVTWDRRFAELMLTVAWVLLVPACFFGYIAFELASSCSRTGCSVVGPRVSVVSALSVAVPAAIVGTVTSRRRPALGRRAWPPAAVALAVVLAALAAGLLGFAATSG